MNKNPQILVLTSTFPRWEDDVEPAFVEDLSVGLSKHFKMLVVAPMFPGAKKTEIHKNHEVHRFSYWPRWLPQLAYEGGVMSKLKRFPWLVFAIPCFLAGQFLTARELMKSRQIAIIHAHWIIPQGFLAILLRQFINKNVKIITTSHGGDLYTLHGGLLNRFKRWIANRADTVTVVSPSMKDHILEMGVVSKVEVAPMGVDLLNKFKVVEPIDSRSGLIFVGRFVEKKGLAYLLRAITILRNEQFKIQIDVLGDGPEKKKLEKYCVDNNIIDCTIFHGSVPNRKVPDFLNNAAVFVMPSIIADDGDQEGLGLVAIEAMGCGCAVVASNLAAIRHSIDDGITGILVKPKSEHELAIALKKLIEQNDYRIELANAGRTSVAARFDWSISIENYKNIYENLLEKTKNKALGF